MVYNIYIKGLSLVDYRNNFSQLVILCELQVNTAVTFELNVHKSINSVTNKNQKKQTSFFDKYTFYIPILQGARENDLNFDKLEIMYKGNDFLNYKIFLAKKGNRVFVVAPYYYTDCKITTDSTYGVIPNETQYINTRYDKEYFDVIKEPQIICLRNTWQHKPNVCYKLVDLSTFNNESFIDFIFVVSTATSKIPHIYSIHIYNSSNPKIYVTSIYGHYAQLKFYVNENGLYIKNVESAFEYKVFADERYLSLIRYFETVEQDESMQEVSLGKTHGSTEERPSSVSELTPFYDESLHRIIYKRGNQWITTSGAIAIPEAIGGNTEDRNISENYNGAIFYDKTLNKPIFKWGSSWLSFDGTQADLKKTNSENYLINNLPNFIFGENLFIQEKNLPVWKGRNTKLVDCNGNPYNAKKIGTTDQRPTDVQFGFIYKDTTLNKLIIWDGTAWVNMDGTELSQ